MVDYENKSKLKENIKREYPKKQILKKQGEEYHIKSIFKHR